MKKRGVSGIIAAVVLILLVLIAVGILWFAIQGIFGEKETQIKGELTKIDLEIIDASVKITDNQGNISLKIDRKIGEGDLVKIKFILEYPETSETYDRESTLKVGEGATYKIPYKSGLEKISVAPIFNLDDNKEHLGRPTDEYRLQGNEPGTPEAPDTCGNGEIDDGEECDNDSEGCSDCKEVYGWKCPENVCEPDYEIDLVALWHLNENYLDSSGNGYDLEVPSGDQPPISQEGKFQTGYGFYGGSENENSRLKNDRTSATDDDFTISFWIKSPEVTNKQVLLSNSWSGSSLNEYIKLESSKIGYTIGTDSIISDSPLSANTWYMITLVWDSENTIIYIDGEEDKRKNIVTPTLGDSTSTYLSPDKIQGCRGTLDEVIIWNRALSGTQVKKLYEMNSELSI